MDLEQLKLILETVGSAGEGTYILGVLYILKGYFYGLIWLGIVWFITRLIMNCVRLESFAGRIGAVYGNKTRWGYPDLSESEKNVVLAAIRKLEVK